MSDVVVQSQIGKALAGLNQIYIGFFPEDWEIVRLGDVGQPIIGLTYRPSDVASSGTLVLRSSNIQQERLSFDDNVFVSVDIPKRVLVQSGDLLICVRNGSRDLIGKSVKLDRRCAGMAFGAFMSVYRSDYNDFFAWVFQSDLIKKQIGEHLGATINQITNRSLASFTVPLPPTHHERRAIAEALADVDALIEGLASLVVKKRAIKQCAAQELLTGKRRLPGFAGELMTKKLGELAELYQPITISAHQFSATGYPVYGANGVVGFFGKTNHDTWQVIVTCRGSTCGTINRTVDRCWITGNAMVLNCDRNPDIDKDFFYHLLCAQDLTTCITGTGQPQIVRTPIAAFEVRMSPNKSEQTAIACILSDMDAEIEAIENKFAKARAIKQGMMQELLTGRVRLI